MNIPDQKENSTLSAAQRFSTQRLSRYKAEISSSPYNPLKGSIHPHPHAMLQPRFNPTPHLYVLPSLCWSSSSSFVSTKGSLISGSPDSCNRFFFRPRGGLGATPPAPPSVRVVVPFLDRSGTTCRAAWEPGGSAETIMGAEMGKVWAEAAVVTREPDGEVITRPGPANKGRWKNSVITSPIMPNLLIPQKHLLLTTTQTEG